ncbi:MAG: M23/M56 family metallopeptidase [Pseudomonadota bacterium]
MIWVGLAVATSLGIGALHVLAASTLTRLNPDNAAWSGLWSLGLWVSAISPLLGFCLYTVAPPTLVEWPETMVFETGLPGLLSLGELPPVRVEAGAQWDPSHVIWIGAGLYALGVMRALARLWLGRRHVRKIARMAVYQGDVNGAAIYVANDAEMPFVWSPFGRPHHARIVLPRHFLTAFSEAEIAHIVRHEHAHIQRRDDEQGLVLRVLLAWLWMSPFAHHAFGRWAQACELQCDANILKGLPHPARAQYAKVLVEALQITANRVRQYPAASFSNDRLRNEKMRISHIMSGSEPLIKTRTMQAFLVSAAAAICVASGVGLASVAHADPAGKTVSDKSTVTLESMVTGRLTAPFGKTFDPFRDGTYRVHKGVDIAAPIGTEITAPADGQIVEATDLYEGQSAYGKVVVLQTANETLTLFSHLDTYRVSAGQRVKRGDLIATVGNTGKSTGPHVHIETLVAGEQVDPFTVWNVR